MKKFIFLCGKWSVGSCLADNNKEAINIYASGFNRLPGKVVFDWLRWRWIYKMKDGSVVYARRSK